MSEWKEYKLGEIAEIVSERVNISFATVENYISTENMINNFGGVTKAEKLPIASSINRFQEKDVLFSNIRTYFKKVWKSTFDGTVSPDVLVFREKKGIVKASYLFYLLCNPDFTEYSVLTSRGAKMPRGDKDALLNYILNLPPLPEQKAIASILSSLDDKIDLLHRQNATLEKMAETLFRQWFVEEAEESWETVKVGDFVKTNIRTVTKEYPFQEIEYLDTSSLTKGVIAETQKLSLNNSPSRAKRLVQNNDILISTVRPDQNHYGIIINPVENLVVSTGFCVITCTEINPYFIYLLLTNNEMTQYLHSIAEGSTSTYPSLKPSDIEKIEFAKPPSSLIIEFGNLVENYWIKINKNQIQIRTLTLMRDNLLPKLMSGEVRVKI